MPKIQTFFLANTWHFLNLGGVSIAILVNKWGGMNENIILLASSSNFMQVNLQKRLPKPLFPFFT